MTFDELIDLTGKGVEAAAVAAIIAGAAYATIRFLLRLRASGDGDANYRAYRRSLGRAILIGLELLIAADIIRTVAIEPTFENLGVLAVLIVIRTVLALEMEYEIGERVPFMRKKGDG